MMGLVNDSHSLSLPLFSVSSMIGQSFFSSSLLVGQSIDNRK
jgi:hypothetical protein